jgi:hypothetical protein
VKAFIVKSLDAWFLCFQRNLFVG